MKFNWGTAITLVIIAFMGFILSLVFMAIGTHSDLYADDYYAQELDFQSRIDARLNADKLDGRMVISQDEGIMRIAFPDDFIGGDLAGEIQFFRPNNAGLDRFFDINLIDNAQSILTRQWVSGWYIVKIDIQSNGHAYFIEERIEIN